MSSPLDSPFPSDKYSHAKQLISAVDSKIWNRMPELHEPIRLDRVSVSEVKEGFLDGEAIKRVIIILRSSGCAWALKPGGRCSMCGHIRGTTRGVALAREHLLDQFEAELERYDFTKYPMLCLYNSGSFLNGEEIPADTRLRILAKIAQTPGIRRLIIESRPEFITPAILDEIEGILGHIKVEIGVGLESANDEIRDLCLNKGFTSRDFQQLGRLFEGRKNAILLAYVLVKPPFLTETEAIQDAIATVKFAFNSGATIVSLEPVSIQDFTLVSFLHEASYFRPPWIWSVVEVARNTHSIGLVRFGGFEFYPVPRTFTHNCPKCDPAFIAAVGQFNATLDISAFDGIECTCQRSWKNDLNDVQEALPDRIIRIFSGLDVDAVLRRMTAAADRRGPSLSSLAQQGFWTCGIHYL